MSERSVRSDALCYYQESTSYALHQPFPKHPHLQPGQLEAMPGRTGASSRDAETLASGESDKLLMIHLKWSMCFENWTFQVTPNGPLLVQLLEGVPQRASIFVWSPFIMSVRSSLTLLSPQLETRTGLLQAILKPCTYCCSESLMKNGPGPLQGLFI